MQDAKVIVFHSTHFNYLCHCVRDNFVNRLSQWDMILQYNGSHWLSSYLEWSLLPFQLCTYIYIYIYIYLLKKLAWQVYWKPTDQQHCLYHDNRYMYWLQHEHNYHEIYVKFCQWYQIYLYLVWWLLNCMIYICGWLSFQWASNNAVINNHLYVKWHSWVTYMKISTM